METRHGPPRMGQGRTALERPRLPQGERHAQGQRGHRERNGMKPYLHANALLESVTPVPNWLDARLNYAFKSLYKAKRKGNSEAIARAQRELELATARLEAWKAAQGNANG